MPHLTTLDRGGVRFDDLQRMIVDGDFEDGGGGGIDNSKANPLLWSKE